MTTRALAERLSIQPIDCADGTRLSPITGGIEITTPDSGIVTVTVRYGWFGPEPKPDAWMGGYVVPTDLEETVRAGLDIVAQRGAVPADPDLSDWIDGSIEPQIVGVYERDFPHSISCPLPSYSLWDGVSWHAERSDVRKAHFERALSSSQNERWRGMRHYPAPAEGHAS